MTPQRPRGARAIVHDDLTQQRRDLLRPAPSYQVILSARRERHKQPDRPFWILALGLRWKRRQPFTGYDHRSRQERTRLISFEKLCTARR